MWEPDNHDINNVLLKAFSQFVPLRYYHYIWVIELIIHFSKSICAWWSWLVIWYHRLKCIFRILEDFLNLLQFLSLQFHGFSFSIQRWLMYRKVQVTQLVVLVHADFTDHTFLQHNVLKFLLLRKKSNGCHVWFHKLGNTTTEQKKILKSGRQNFFLLLLF